MPADPLQHLVSPSVRCAFLLLLAAAPAPALEVIATYPPRLARQVPPSAAISIRFDAAVDPASISPAAFRAFGRSSGAVAGTFTFHDGDTLVRLRPGRPFQAGEVVLVNLAASIEGAGGGTLQAGGFAFQFTVAAERGSRVFEAIDTLNVRSDPDDTTRLYGALPLDLDENGFIDLVTVNEISADLRVLMNASDGSGLFDDFLVPTTPVGPEASPNEPGDFDNDGDADVAVVNASESSVSVVLGNGDGSFAAERVLAVGSTPHGIAALDVDGDADTDLVTSNFGGSNLSVLVNDGAANFAAAVSFDSGGLGEWTIGAGDFDGDGIYDLAVGCLSGEEVRIFTGDGDGTFTFSVARDAEGSPWMLALADLDGDSDLDVTVANSYGGNGAAIPGDGAGGLGTAVPHAISGGAISSELGDFDGDGDPDWVMSSYSGARWELWLNDGAGAFTFDQRWLADEAGSCAVAFDSDGDADLDLALFDELTDDLFLERNSGSPAIVFADRFESADATGWSVAAP
jgi:hypothetical protein